MSRPTIADLAVAASVSVSTVNRVLSGREHVRSGTVELVLAAAERIGFYGVRSIRNRLHARRESLTFGILLLQGNRSFYRGIGQALERAAAAVGDLQITLQIEFMDDLSPDVVAERMEHLGEAADAIAVVTAEHPRITQAIEKLAARGVPTFALISQLTAATGVGYIGLNNWKKGRTSAWLFSKMCPNPGKIGILVGNHRYRSQELNEIGFRSYFREHYPAFQLLEPLSTYETVAIAQEVTEKLIATTPDLIGLFISGGGVRGALAALRDAKPQKRIIVVGYERTAETQAALIGGILDAVLAHPVERMASEAISAMREAVAEPKLATRSVIIPFDIFTSENL